MTNPDLTIAVYSGNIPSTTFIENLIEGMAESGFRIFLFGKKSREVSYKGDVRILSTPQGSLGLSAFVMMQSVKLAIRDRRKFMKLYTSVRSRNRSIIQFMRDMGALLPIINNPCDVFHIQWAKTLQVYPEIMELTDAKIALSLRGAHINYSPLHDESLADSYRKYFPSVDAFHAVSNAIAKEAARYGADEGKVNVIYSSVKESLLSEDLPEISRSGKFSLISVGRFHWKKGYHYGLDAVKKLTDEGFECSYTIVAQGDLPEEMIFLINEYGISDKVTIIPGLEYSELIKKLKASNALLLPSVEEGIANVVLEAMAVGVPVITTDCGGMKEAVDDGVDGYVVRVRDSTAIAMKIKELSGLDEAKARKIVSNAREKIRRKFARDRQKNEFAEFYRKTAAG